MISITTTYDIVTPESAENGGTADHGFAEPGGWHYSISDNDFHARCEAVGRDQALADMTPAPMVFETVQDAVDELLCHGPFEASSSTLDQYTWLIGPGETDYSDGSVTQYSFHISANPSQTIAVLMGALGQAPRVQITNCDDSPSVLITCDNRYIAEIGLSVAGSLWEAPSDLAIAYAIVDNQQGLVEALEQEGYDVDDSQYSEPDDDQPDDGQLDTIWRAAASAIQKNALASKGAANAFRAIANGQPDDGQPDDGQPDDGQPDDGQPDDGQPDDDT